MAFARERNEMCGMGNQKSQDQNTVNYGHDKFNGKN